MESSPHTVRNSDILLSHILPLLWFLFKNQPPNSLIPPWGKQTLWAAPHYQFLPQPLNPSILADRQSTGTCFPKHQLYECYVSLGETPWEAEACLGPMRFCLDSAVTVPPQPACPLPRMPFTRFHHMPVPFAPVSHTPIAQSRSRELMHGEPSELQVPAPHLQNHTQKLRPGLMHRH